MNILVLDSTNKTLQAVTTAYSSVQPNFTVHYADATAGSFVEGSADGVVPTTVGIILAAPASLARRVVKELTIYNGDTGSVTITLSEYNNTTQRIIETFTLASGETYVLSEKSPEQLGSQIHASANKTTPVDADEVGIWNSVTGLLGKLSWSSIKSTLKTYFDPIYYPIGSSQFLFNARLTLETGVAVSTTDQTAKTSVYLSPYMGNQIATYSGTAWGTLPLSADISLSLSGYTADKNYDIWVYNNAGVLALESTIWYSDTVRWNGAVPYTTLLPKQDGVFVKSTNGTAIDSTRRYVGTIRITATTGQCEDSVVSRLVCNYYNQVARPQYVADMTAHTVSTAYRKWNNSDTNNKLTFISGTSETPMRYSMGGDLTGGTSTYALISMYMDGVPIPNSAAVINFAPYRLKGGLSAVQKVDAGLHTVQIYELSSSSLTFDAMLMSVEVMG